MAKVLRAEVKAADLPRPRGEQGEGSFTEIEVPGDYEVVLEAVEDYDFTDKGKTAGWIFKLRCEYAEGRSVVFDHYLAHTDKGMWKINEAFDALEAADLEEGVREFNPNSLIGNVCAAHIDFPRDSATNEPTSKYREIRWLFRLPDDAEIQELVPDATPTPEPEPGLDNQTAEEPTTL